MTKMIRTALCLLILSVLLAADSEYVSCAEKSSKLALCSHRLRVAQHLRYAVCDRPRSGFLP